MQHESSPAGSSPADSTTKRSWWHQNEKDVLRWAELFRSGKSVVEIAANERVAPSTVSSQLHTLGIDIYQGRHHVSQLPLKYSSEFVNLVNQGPGNVIEFVKDWVWGIGVTDHGRQQVQSFCEFIELHQQGVGVKEIARRLDLHRTTVAEWREGTDQPYLIRAVSDTLPIMPRTRWKLLPMHLTSGGNEPSGWIQVPQAIHSFADVLEVLNQIEPPRTMYERSLQFGLSRQRVEELRSDLFAYLLGIMVGDSGKLGGVQNRYASMNLDLQLTKKHPTNERLGEFVLLCANSLNIKMERKRDKPPTGATRLGKQPTHAYRWISERSPLLAWMFSVCLGLRWEETTTTEKIRIDWIFETSTSFRVRFMQGVADSDGCVKSYVVEIESVPNSALLVEILHGVGITSAHIGYEKGLPEKTRMNRRQASTLPIFNEFVRSYRYERMMKGTNVKPALLREPGTNARVGDGSGI